MAVLFTGLTAETFAASDENDKATTIQHEIIDDLNNRSRELAFINPSVSFKLADSALNLSENYKKGKAYAYRNIANIYVLNNFYSLGTQYLSNATDMFTALNDSAGLADCYISYGHLYQKLNNTENEIFYFKRAYEVYKHKNQPERQSVCAFNLAESYSGDRQFSKSRQYLDEAISIAVENKQLALLSACYKLKGELELEGGNTGNAEYYFSEVLRISSELGENSQKIVMLESTIHLAEIYEKKGEKNLQLKCLNEALSEANRNNLSAFVISVYRSLIDYYLNEGKTKTAANLISELNHKADSINRQHLDDQANLVNNLLYTYSLEKEKGDLENANHIQAKALKIRSISLITMSITLLFIVSMLIILVRAQKMINRQYRELQMQNLLITNQKAELSELLASRDRLLSIIAHDLKNPFNSMLLTLQIMEIDLLAKDDSRIEKNIARLSKTAKSTYELLEKLLMWAKSQKENVKPVQIDLPLQTSINESMYGLAEQAQYKNIEISILPADGIVVHADKDMVQTILRNLIQNAIKFTPVGGEIKISAKTNANMAEICIQDSGIGMNEQTVNSIFNIDKQKIRNGTQGETGSGLGLALCKFFVEKNNGSIRIESKLNLGSSFIFTLPLASDSVQRQLMGEDNCSSI